MKLLELLGVKKYSKLTLGELIQKFAEHHKLVGNGHFSYVFKREHEVVKFWVKDDAYEKFIEYVQHHHHDVHLPRFFSKIKEIHSFHYKASSFPDKIKYIRMEILRKIEPSDLKLKSKDSLNMIFDSLQEAIEEKIAHENDAIERWKKNVAIDFKDVYENGLPKELETFVDSCVSIADSLKRIDLVTKRGRKSLDLNEDNVMSRNDGTLVILDPVAYETSANVNSDIRWEERKISGALP